MQVADRINSLCDFKCEALFIERQFIEGPPASFPALSLALQDLVDRFYQGNGDLVTCRQYNIAKDGLDYFIVLVEQLLRHYKEEQWQTTGLK
jgi:hypothetical protein